MVLGAAFSSIVDSLVTDVLLPPIGLLLSQMNFPTCILFWGVAVMKHWQKLRQQELPQSIMDCF